MKNPESSYRRDRNFSIKFLSLLLFFITSCATTKNIRINSSKTLDEEQVLIYDQPFYFSSKEELKNNRYIFIRLYNPVYKQSWSSGSILQKGINIVEVNNISASHAALGFSLKDDFYGLTYFARPNLKVEHCTETWKNEYMKSCKPKKSMQTVLGLKVSIAEYEKVLDLVRDFLMNQNITYDLSKNFQMAMLTIGRKVNSIKTGSVQQGNNFADGAETPAIVDSEVYDKEKKYNLVCSTFISYVLYNCVESYRNWIDLNNYDWNNIGPSDFINFPELKVMFSSTWSKYNHAAEKYIESKKAIADFLE